MMTPPNQTKWQMGAESGQSTSERARSDAQATLRWLYATPPSNIMCISREQPIQDRFIEVHDVGSQRLIASGMYVRQRNDEGGVIRARQLTHLAVYDAFDETARMAYTAASPSRLCALVRQCGRDYLSIDVAEDEEQMAQQMAQFNDVSELLAGIPVTTLPNIEESA